MRRALWLTDLHFEFLENEVAIEFMHSLRDYSFDMLWVTGDISTSNHLQTTLKMMTDTIQKPIYFVLGNHDFYGESVDNLEKKIQVFSQQNKYLHYLSCCDVIELNNNHALIGHDTWSDGRNGAYFTSDIVMNDFFGILNFRGLNKEERLLSMQKLADKSVSHIRQALNNALQKYKHIWMLTHVPPFKNSCVYKGKIADDNWLPFFSCKVMADFLKSTMSKHPKQTLTVISGHTHSHSVVNVLDNLTAIVGGAEYCHPKMQKIFDFDNN